MAVRFETESWPIVAAHIEGVLDDPHVEEIMARLGEWLDTGEHVAIYDLSINRSVQFEHLAQMGRWIRAQGPRLVTQKGTIFVVASPFMRAAVNFILEMAPDGGNFRLVASMEEARGVAAQLIH